MLAAGIVAWAVALPGRLGHQLREGLVVPVRNQVARAFPPLHVVGRVAPGGAGQLALALQEFQVHGRLPHRILFGDALDVLEFLVDVIARQEDFAVVHGGVAVRRRNLVAVHVELPEILEQLFDLAHVRLFIDGGVGAYLEARGLGRLEALDGFAEYAFAFDAKVVGLLHAVQVHIEVEAPVRLEFLQTLLDEHAVGAEIDVPVALQDARRQIADRRIHHGLAAANRDHRRAAFIDRQKALLERHPLGDGGFVLANAPAARARQVAGVQRLEHQHDRKTLADHGMRLALLTGLGRQNTERVGRRRTFLRGVLLPLRTGPHLVPENVSGQAGGHRYWKLHKLSIRVRPGLHERRQREQREIVFVQVIVQVEHFRNPRPGGQILPPASILALGSQQVFDAVLDARAGGVASGDQTQNRPRGLRRRARAGREDAVIVAGAAFAPTAIRVLDGTQPLAGAQDVRFAVALPRRRQAPQRETCAVDVRHAPTAVPAS